ncbi:hypothetical protein, partial [Aeromonas salmonicida]
HNVKLLKSIAKICHLISRSKPFDVLNSNRQQCELLTLLQVGRWLYPLVAGNTVSNSRLLLTDPPGQQC